MCNYNPNDITSTLIYIKNKYGLDTFVKNEKIIAFLGDLAPNLKNESFIIGNISKLGILKEFVSNTKSNEDIKKDIILKSKLRMSQSGMDTRVATRYLYILIVVFEWNVGQEILDILNVSDEKEYVDKTKFLIEKEKQEALSRIKLSTFEEYCIYIGIAVAGFGWIFCLLDHALLGIILIIMGVGMVLNYYQKNNKVKKLRKKISKQYEEKYKLLKI